jgi:transposase
MKMPRSVATPAKLTEALRKGLLPNWRRSQLFMQENAFIHTSKSVRKFLADDHVTLITWPPYSPDLNPLEHLWWHLKKRMHRFYPQFNKYSVAKEKWEAFCKALKECWRSILEKLIRSLIVSMPRQIAAIRKAREW